MAEHIYRIAEIVGTSPDGVDDAIRNAVSRASQTLRVQAEVRLGERHETGLHPRQHAGRNVVLVPGLQDDRLVSGLRQGEDRGGDRF